MLLGASEREGERISVNAILGLGIVDLALAIGLMIPLSVATKKNEYMSSTFDSLFKVCLTVGSAMLVLTGFMVLAS